MYYAMTTMWRALNQRGLRRVYAQSLILGRCEASWGEPERYMTVSTRLSDSVFTETH